MGEVDGRPVMGGVAGAQDRRRVSRLGRTLFEVSTRARASAMFEAYCGLSPLLQDCAATFERWPAAMGASGAPREDEGGR